MGKTADEAKSKKARGDKSTRKYVEHFNTGDHKSGHKLGKDVNEANYQLLRQKSQFRIVPDEDGEWHARTEEEVRKDWGIEDDATWVVNQNMNGVWSVQSEESEPPGGDTESESFAEDFNREPADVSKQDVDQANGALAEEGSDYRIWPNPDTERWEPIPLEDLEAEYGKDWKIDLSGDGWVVKGKTGPNSYQRSIDPQLYAEGRWVTIHGTHVYIKNGKITKGPEHLVNLKPEHAEPILKMGPQKWWKKNHAEDEPGKAGEAKPAASKPAESKGFFGTPEKPAKAAGGDLKAAKGTLADIAKAHIREKSVGIAFDQLYKQAKEKHPDLSKEDFRALMNEFHSEGDQFRLGGWGRMFDDLPDPELATHLGGEKTRGPRDKADRSKAPNLDEVGRLMYLLQPASGSL